jgi:arylsulfatase A
MSGDGHWKLHVPHTYRTLVESGNNGKPGKFRQASVELSLFDMEKDPFETIDVIDKYPEVAARLKMYAEQHRKEFFN